MTQHQPAWLTEAQRHLGFHEKPVNITPFGEHFGLQGEPWCAMFVSYCFEKSGHPLPSMQAGMKDGYAAVVYAMEYAQKHKCWRPSWEAEPGDVIVYGWNGPGSSPDEMHTGFIVSSGPAGTTGHTLEGNRGDQVESQTFTVGETVVLGTIDVKSLLGLNVVAPVVDPTLVPKPQPRSSDHPVDSGPTPLPPDTVTQIIELTEMLKLRTVPVQRGGGERRAMRELIVELEHALDG